MNIKRIIGMIIILGCLTGAGLGIYELWIESPPRYQAGELEKPIFTQSPPDYEYKEKDYDLGYSLPLKELPTYYDNLKENLEKMGERQKRDIMNKGVTIVPSRKEFRRFSYGYRYLEEKDLPILITSDSLLHLLHIEFDQILRELEEEKIYGWLNSFLESVINHSESQYAHTEKNKNLRKLIKRNIAYLSVAKKLLDPSYNVKGFVKESVQKELSQIKQQKGKYKSDVLSQDCSPACEQILFTEEGKCKKRPENFEQIEETCSKNCYCEDYSKYKPEGHYKSSSKLENYYKAMTWLKEMNFKPKGENWAKQAVYLTDAVKSSKATIKQNEIQKEVPAYKIWRKIYSITQFFNGGRKTVNFYNYDNAIAKIFNYDFDIEAELGNNNISESIITHLANTDEFEAKEFDNIQQNLTGQIQNKSLGLSFFEKGESLSSEIIKGLSYENVGPNPDSITYKEVLQKGEKRNELSESSDFYSSCDNLSGNRDKYWEELAETTMKTYGGNFDLTANSDTTNGNWDKEISKAELKKIFKTIPLMPTSLYVVDILGSTKAQKILNKYYPSSKYCYYKEAREELMNKANSYKQEDWSRNFENMWLWLLKSVMKEKPEGYPTWMRNEVWKIKEMITSLSSWTELIHEPILSKRENQPWRKSLEKEPPEKRDYYGYVEPNPEFFARIKFIADYIKSGLKHQEIEMKKIYDALDKTSKLALDLYNISKTELAGKEISNERRMLIEDIENKFDSILEDVNNNLQLTEGVGKYGRGEKDTKQAREVLRSNIISDPYQDSNTNAVLKTGTDKIDWVAIVYHSERLGKKALAVGPIFSYYEFIWAGDKGLQGQKWEKEQITVPKIKRPSWYKELSIDGADFPLFIKEETHDYPQ